MLDILVIYPRFTHAHKLTAGVGNQSFDLQVRDLTLRSSSSSKLNEGISGCLLQFFLNYVVIVGSGFQSFVCWTFFRIWREEFLIAGFVVFAVVAPGFR